ncbi:MAG: DUF433 domain-containing protein [Candidatus Promineifilaceae bacterium]
MALVLEQHIEVTEGLRGGKPHLSGTRITVSDVAIWHLRLGQPLEEVAARYDLSLAAVYAALAYYFDHRAEIDEEIEASRSYYDMRKRASRSLVDQKLQAMGRE